MAEWVSHSVGTIGGVIALIVALGAAAAYLRSSWDKGAIAGLEKYKEVADARMAQMAAEAKTKAAETAALVAGYQGDVKALTLRVETLERENEELRAKRPSAEAIAEVMAMQQVLHEQITAHDEEVKAFMARTEEPGK